MKYNKENTDVRMSPNGFGSFIQLILLTFSKKKVMDDKESFKNELLRRVDCSYGQELDSCPVIAEWSAWGEWGPCVGECGQVGLRKRARFCKTNSTAEGDISCSGIDHESVECHMAGCSQENYEKLLSCDYLRKNELHYIKNIHINYPSLVEKCLHAECRFSFIQSVLGELAEHYWTALRCVKHNVGCPVVGGWSDWGKWSDCSSKCGNGVQISCRTCDNPIPTYDRLSCKGDNCTTRQCEGFDCTDMEGTMWSSWSPWTDCSVSCGQGTVERKRKCWSGEDPATLPDDTTDDIPECITMNAPANSSSIEHQHRRSCSNYQKHLQSLTRTKTLCIGPFIEFQPCYQKPCPVDGGWSDWEPWSQCSHGCDVGLQSRSRACSSPPPIGGGTYCLGPAIKVRHCFLKPCYLTSHEVAVFSGDGHLRYKEFGRDIRLLHLYVKFLPLAESGVIILRVPKISLPRDEQNNVKLSMISGYLIFFSSIGGCHVSAITQKTLELNKWNQVLLMVTSCGVTMRINDNDNYVYGQFSCEPERLNFRAEMEVGTNFIGQIARLHVNFVKRKLNVAENEDEPTKRSVYPYSNLNVEYEEAEMDENIRSLDELILVPCSNQVYWSIQIVVRTLSSDGILMLLSDRIKFLILSFEPRRVQLHLVLPDGMIDCFQVIEPHVGHWIHVKVDYSKDESWGLTVNGEQRKMIRHYNNLSNTIKCTDHIMIGDVASYARTQLKKEVYGLNFDSLKGDLGDIKVDDIELDIDSLLAEVEKGNCLMSSETISSSSFVEEIELTNGDQLNITCLHYYKQNSSIKTISSTAEEWNFSKPMWLRFDTPLVKFDLQFMRKIVFKYDQNSQNCIGFTQSYLYCYITLDCNRIRRRFKKRTRIIFNKQHVYKTGKRN